VSVPTTPEEAFFARLASGVALKALVADRITPALTDQEVMLPCVTYQRTGKEARNRLNGTSRLARYTMTATAYADTEAGAHAVSNAVHDLICPDGGWADASQGVQGAFAGDSTEDVTDDGIRTVARPFEMFWAPLTPPPAFGYYPLNGSGTDASGNAHNLGGGTYGTPTSGTVKFGSACLVRLTASLTGLGLAVPPALLVSLWFFANGGGISPGASFVGWMDASGNPILAIQPTTGVSPSVATWVNNAAGFTSGTLATSAWHHVAVSASGGSVKTWVDGVLQDTRSGVPAGTIDGVRVAITGTSAGGIDDVGVAQAPLVQGNVDYLWNSGTGRTYV
jgi:hypothetical protein